MAKKQNTVDTVEKPVFNKKIETPVSKKKDDWVIKDRMYILKDGVRPLSYSVNQVKYIGLTRNKGTKESLNILQIRKLFL
jgi:hypothetical protein